MNSQKIQETIVDLLTARAADASICPSDVARSMTGDQPGWRALMDPVRQVAASLAQSGLIRVTQGQTVVDLSQPVKGPVRLRRGIHWPRD
ncbi:MAG: DUF3253 domain-containing protein [Polaromonas sp.]|nr:DUF3253 domain-containing protein [Polaromonas sp.]